MLDSTDQSEAPKDAGLESPLHTVTFFVVDSTAAARVGDRAFLIRDRASSRANAVEVRLESGEVAGRVPDTEALQIASLLDGGAAHRAEITGILEKGGRRVPEITASIFALGTNAKGAVYEQDVPRKRSTAPWVILCVLLVIVGGYLVGSRTTPAPGRIEPSRPVQTSPASPSPAESLPPGYIRVRGYTRRDGTKVESYIRRK